MFQFRRFVDTYEMIELRQEGSWLKICPERGGILTSLGFLNEELLYLDKATFADKSTNIRGGNPILFPICGQLKNGTYVWNQREYQMKNHGFARDLEWILDESSIVTSANHASVTLIAQSNAETLASYPFPFELRFTYVLSPTRLDIRQVYVNRSSEEMPFYAGFHPYFTSQSKILAFDSDATHYLDYNDMQVYPFQGTLDFTSKVESVALYDAKTRAISFSLEERAHPIRLEYSSDFRNVQIWSVQGKDFICVEPWMALTYALNTGDGLLRIPPGQEHASWLSIVYGQ